MPIHLYFGHSSHRDSIGSEFSRMQVLMGLSLAVGPVLGGIIITQFGWQALFAAALAILVITSFFLIFSPEIYESYTKKLRELLSDIRQKGMRKELVAFAGTGSENVTRSVVWPLFLFVLGINFSSIGMISAAAILVASLFTLYIGSLSDHLPKSRITTIGFSFLSLTWISRILVSNPITAFISDVIYGFSSSAANIPFMARFYEQFSDSRGYIVVLRETTLSVGRMLTFLFLAFLFSVTEEFTAAFVMAALAALFFYKELKMFL